MSSKGPLKVLTLGRNEVHWLSTSLGPFNGMQSQKCQETRKHYSGRSLK